MERLSAWSDFSLVPPEESDLLIMGVPFDGGVSASRGAAAAPDKLRDLSNYLSAFSETGVDLRRLKIADLGNIPVNLNWEHYFQEVRERARELCLQEKFALFLGGDHSVTIPLLQAFSRCHWEAPIGVVQLDAHCDLMAEYDGHPWSHACTARRSLELPNLDAERLVLVGIRTFEPEEREYLDSAPGLQLIGAREIYRQGIDAALARIVRALEGAAAVYISLDIDVLDPAFAPGTGTPEAGGLSSREAMELVRGLIGALPVRAMDITEISPPLDCSGITCFAALKIIAEVFGALVEKRESPSGKESGGGR